VVLERTVFFVFLGLAKKWDIRKRKVLPELGCLDVTAVFVCVKLNSTAFMCLPYSLCTTSRLIPNSTMRTSRCEYASLCLPLFP